jgi:putative hydrolase of the HAD superfamily
VCALLAILFKGTMSMGNQIEAILIDFGGVIAEEGFLEGLRALGRKNGIDPDEFFKTVDSLIYETGYLTGKTDEAAFWAAVRKKTGIKGTDQEFREEILSRFVLRPEMLALVESLRSMGINVAILSDQTNWLEEIEMSTALFRHFDGVFNSYRMKQSKRNASVFTDVCAVLGVDPQKTLFVDDNSEHIGRAQERGLSTIQFVNITEFEDQLKKYFPGLKPANEITKLS